MAVNQAYISEKATIGENVHIGINCIIEEGAVIGDNTYIDSNTIIRCGTCIGRDSFVGANCIIGEYLSDFIDTKVIQSHSLEIGADAVIRSNTVIYTGSVIGDHLSTGHHVTVREKSIIGNNVSIGTLSDIQGNCRIGSYVRMHSNVHVGQLSDIGSFVWIYPYVVLTNDATPPSEEFMGVHIAPFAIIATSATILPGLSIGSDTLVAAGAVVTGDVDANELVAGVPARVIGDVRNVRNHVTGESVYPWRYRFDRYMPWKDMGYENWYDSLDDSEKDKLGILKTDNKSE